MDCVAHAEGENLFPHCSWATSFWTVTNVSLSSLRTTEGKQRATEDNRRWRAFLHNCTTSRWSYNKSDRHGQRSFLWVCTWMFRWEGNLHHSSALRVKTENKTAVSKKKSKAKNWFLKSFWNKSPPNMLTHLLQGWTDVCLKEILTGVFVIKETHTLFGAIHLLQKLKS